MNEERQPSRPEITAQIERILASAHFRTTAVQAKLLRFVIQQSFDNKDVSQKDILAELYNGAYVDPNSAKSTANLVRGKLKKYYAAEGVNDPVRIQLLPGRGYKPWFGYNGSAKSVRLYDAAMARRRELSLRSLEDAWNLFAEAYALNPENPAMLADWSETTLLLFIAEETLRATSEKTRPLLRPLTVQLALYALQLNPRAWLPLVLIGTVLFLSYDRDSARLLFEEALECDAGKTESSLWYAFYLIASGRTKDGLEIVESQRWAGSANAGVHLAAAFLCYLARDYERAWACHRDALAWGTEQDITFLVEGLLRLELEHLRGTALDALSQVSTEMLVEKEWPDRRDGKETFLHKRVELSPVFGIIMLCQLSPVRQDLFFPKHAQDMMAEVRSRKFPCPKPIQMAIAYMALGRTARAVAFIRRALRGGDASISLLDSLPLLDPLRASARFRIIVRSIAVSGYRAKATYPEHARLIAKASRKPGEWWLNEEESPIFLYPAGHSDR